MFSNFQFCQKLHAKRRHPGRQPAEEEQAEEGEPGEEAGEKGGQDAVGHPHRVHRHLDPVQRLGHHVRDPRPREGGRPHTEGAIQASSVPLVLFLPVTKLQAALFNFTRAGHFRYF